ncbi:hypothetical protein F4820DRAFT_445388 [Hypoxylon rubiginosum]|uniref:Uncharacterized protein n=1 Tax=Hypoxylon rubiginosum TaxID=110542 RepID=A0ACB9Z9Z7_9PEZI|nr:hypothetical protein F4820DRAFT_445388 [Hypoxylon rubiginosum]
MASNNENAPAWTVKQKEIDDFINRIAKRRASAAFIQGPHGSGKSTTMVVHILALLQTKLPGARLVYLMPTLVEGELLRNYLTSDEFNAQLPASIWESSLPSGSLDVQSYKSALQSFRESRTFQFFKTGAVVLVDLEINPTADGEMLLGHILESADSSRAEGPGCAVITVSTFESARTEAAMDRVMGRKPTVIRIPQTLPVDPIDRMPEPWRDYAKGLVSNANAAQGRGEIPERVMIGQSLFGEVHDELYLIERSSMHEEETLAVIQQNPEVVLTASDMCVSLRWLGLRHFVSDGLVKCQMFDRKTSQIVSLTRRMTKTEISVQQSWLLKSDRPREDTIFHTTYDDFDRRLLGSDPAGEAYGGDFTLDGLELDPRVAVNLARRPTRQTATRHSRHDRSHASSVCPPLHQE